MVRVLPVCIPRTSRLGRYFRRCAVSKTRLRVASDVPPWPASTSETVAWLTPAAKAIRFWFTCGFIADPSIGLRKYILVGSSMSIEKYLAARGDRPENLGRADRLETLFKCH